VAGNALNRTGGAAATWLLLAVAPTLAATPTVESFVQFHTVCTNCHEGECSGRLSFDSGAAAARSHIERHIGTVSDGKLAQLFAMLRHVKETCSNYPQLPVRAAKGVWPGEELAVWRNPLAGAYFIPLGILGAGHHGIVLEFGEPADGDARLVDDRMETSNEERLCRDTRKTIELEGQPARFYYLHLKSRMALKHIEFIAPGGP
jgi:hypothetical protein